AAHVLHPSTQRLPGAYHVLIDIGDDVSARFQMLGEILVLGGDFIRPPETDISLRTEKAPGGDFCFEGAGDFQQVSAPAAVIVGRGFLLLHVGSEYDGLIVVGGSANESF